MVFAEFLVTASDTCFCVPFRKAETGFVNLGAVDTRAGCCSLGVGRLHCASLDVQHGIPGLHLLGDSSIKHAFATYFFSDTEPNCQLDNVPNPVPHFPRLQKGDDEHSGSNLHELR